MKKIYWIIVILFYGIAAAKAQEIAALRIGDVLPDLEFGKTVPVKNTAGRTSDYKDKLLILDLWGTSCAPCIAIMPKLDSLQKQFGQAIKILPVTPEKEDFMNNFWRKNRYTKDLAISTVVEGRIFSGYFPHRFISHDIWVYKGKVIAITGMEQVTAVNIQKILAGQQVNLPLKDDFISEFNGAAQSLQNSAIAISKPLNLTKYATVSKFREGIITGGIVNADRGGVVSDSATRGIRSYFINQSVYVAYLWALMNAQGKSWIEIVNATLGGNAAFPPTRVVWEVTDRSKYVYEKGTQKWDDWMGKNALCFESLYPDTGQTGREAYRQIARDMNDLLGLNVRFEKRKVKTLVLTRTSQADLLKTKNPGIDASYHEFTEGSCYKLRDNNLWAFINEFNQHSGNPYAIDGISYKGKVDMDLNIPDWKDIPALRKELGKYGLALKQETHEVEMLVFTETGGGYR